MYKCKNEKEKVRKHNARIYQKKKGKEAKNFTQALREVNACVASGGWVPMSQEAATAIHPKAEEHPQAYQPTTQPWAPPCPAPTIAPVTLRPEAQWK